MGKTTNIPWTDHTWSPWKGCEKVSPGCKNCYAETIALKFNMVGWGSAPREKCSEAHWRLPVTWNRAAERAGATVRCFPSTIDPFEMRPEMQTTFRRFVRLIEDTPWIEWLLLTKRPENIEPAFEGLTVPRNIRLGISAENQKYLLQRIVPLSRACDKFRLPNFVSAEPLIDELDFSVEWLTAILGAYPFNLERKHRTLLIDLIDFLIVGGESGKNWQDRPMKLEWAATIRDQCKAAGVPFHFKQVNSFLPDQRGNCPDDLYIREMPPPMRAPNTLWTEAPITAEVRSTVALDADSDSGTRPLHPDTDEPMDWVAYTDLMKSRAK